MRKFLTLVIGFLLIPSVCFAAGLTDDQKERLNEIGAPSSISSSFQTQLGDVVDVLKGGSGGSTTVAAGTAAIPVRDSSGNPYRYITKNTNAAETCTLANGVEGQTLTITHRNDGGSCTVTPTTTANFATCTLSDPGDTVTLTYVDSTVGWVIEGTVSTSGSGAPACTQ